MSNALAPKLAQLTTILRHNHKRSIWFRRVQGITTLFNFCAVLFSVLYMTKIGALLQLCIGWYLYRHYLKALRRERRWLVCLNHVQRVWVNRTDEQTALWHSNQIDLEIEKAKRDQ